MDEREQPRPQHTRLGLMRYSYNKTDNVYWNDINKLADLLRLASQQAGHGHHDNEIASILEELKEAYTILLNYKLPMLCNQNSHEY